MWISLAVGRKARKRYAVNIAAFWGGEYPAILLKSVA
jgi:hypothetical protein